MSVELLVLNGMLYYYILTIYSTKRGIISGMLLYFVYVITGGEKIFYFFNNISIYNILYIYQ